MSFKIATRYFNFYTPCGKIIIFLHINEEITFTKMIEYHSKKTFTLNLQICLKEKIYFKCLF